MKNKRIILDTNLWISFLISKKLELIDGLISNGKIKLIFSKELIKEFISVAKRAKFKKYFSDVDLKEILRLFDSYGILVNVEIEVNECRDEKDNFLLALAVERKANYLITGDSDLLSLEKIEKTKILTWNEFIEEFK
jgi:uncharacterized protein